MPQGARRSLNSMTLVKGAETVGRSQMMESENFAMFIYEKLKKKDNNCTSISSSS